MNQAAVRASGAALLAALLWAAYYFFVFGVSARVAPSALLFWPFALGGMAYTGVALVRGHATTLAQLYRDPRAWLRSGMLVAMQTSVLASTFVAGAVDTSILSLLGDVVITPLLVMLLLRENRELARAPAFVLGVVLAAGGGILTILAGGSPRPISGIGVLVTPAVAVSVAVYFLLSAQAGRRLPTTAVIAQSVVGGAIVSFAISPLLPGGFAGLAIGPPIDVGLVAALGVTSFCIAPLLYFDAIQRVGLLLPAVLMAAIPVFTLLLAIPLLGFLAPPVAILGIPIAVVGAILASRGSHTPWRTETSAPAVSGGSTDP
ncbi:MAG TPA: DMT family transporter [Thermoplasmata archaeon]|nr:DMT family transporter [Thermoplasmata archaeon]